MAGVSASDILEIMKLVGPQRSSVVREAVLLGKERDRRLRQKT